MGVIGRGERVRPWLALALSPTAWFVYELGLGVTLGPSCRAVGDWLGPLWGALSLLACAAAAAIAWPVAQRADGDNPPARPWLAKVATGVAIVFALAIALQTLATTIVPPCVR